MKELRFPPAWAWLVDELIPGYVKKHYSPRDSWKDKPFTKEDTAFFSRGVKELSDLFTEDRPRSMPAYFQHPKFRSSYLLYFLPLQAAKFIAVFQQHPEGVSAALEHGRKTGVLRVVDLGAGPGTASIALLTWLLGASKASDELPAIEFDWFDTNEKVMEDGRALAEAIASNFRRLRGKVTIRTHVAPWWKAAALERETSLVLLGHVLNEAPPSRQQGEEPSENLTTLAPLVKLVKRMRGGGMLAVEPAAKRPSQQLSQLRDQLIESGAIPGEAASFWGPCLHSGRCPLAMGRDWCHFSVHAEIPGQWFGSLSRSLGSERHWLKYSYLWLASTDARAATLPDPMRRILSDTMLNPRSGTHEVLICEPGQVGRWPVPKTAPLFRGGLLNLDKAKLEPWRGGNRNERPKRKP